MKKVLFCYFSPSHITYTPLDIAYIQAIIEEKKMSFAIEILHIDQKYYSETDYKKLAYYLLSFDPDAIFFFLDSVIWSRTYAIESAKKIAYNIRNINTPVFLGIQSYKTKKQDQESIIKEKIFDIIIKTNPEDSFSFLDAIFQKQEVSGTVFLDLNSQLCNIPERENEIPLSRLPSPYLSGVLDKMLKTGALPRVFLQTSRGCPFQCYYCFRSIKFESMRFFPIERIYNEIEYVLNNFQIFYFDIIDDCFITSHKRLQEFVEEFEKRKQKNPLLEKIQMFAMSRPEYLNKENIQLLQKINITKVQLGLQTIHPDLQIYINRKIPIEQFRTITHDLQNAGIQFQLDIIFGLPNDTIEYFKKTLDFSISLKPYQLQVKQLYHQPNTYFDEHKENFQISPEDVARDFSVPYIRRAQNIQKNYQDQAYQYLQKKMKEHPEIQWVYLSEHGSN